MAGYKTWSSARGGGPVERHAWGGRGKDTVGIAGRGGRHTEPPGCVCPGGSETAPLQTSLGAPAPRPGRPAGRRGRVPGASGLCCRRGRARRGSAGVRPSPGAASAPAALLGGTRTAEARPRRRGRHRPGELRGGGTGRPGTGRAGGDPAAGPAGLGGLGRPLPLQPSEMAEHVAIMPRHSGCPARPALISGPRTPLLSPCAPRKGNKTQHVSSAPAHKAPGLGLSGGQSGPSISAPGPLCPSPPCHTFCSRIQ